MIFSPKPLILRDGREAVLQTPEVSDAEGMLRFIRTACGETDFLARTAAEWDAVPVEEEAKWVENIRSAPDHLMIACFVDGEIAGDANILFSTNVKTRHRASVSIALLREYWGLGIGTALFTELLAAAKARGTQIVELEYISGNERAKRLYEKFGFRDVSVRPDAYRLPDGTYRDEIYMQKRLMGLPAGYVLRPARESDAEGIARVHSAAWRETYAGLLPDAFLTARTPERSLPMTKANWRNISVAETGGEIVGFCGISQSRDADRPDDGEIQGLYVLRAHRRIGLGRALLEDGVRRLQAAGHTSVLLWALAANEPALRFYTLQGFHRDGAEKAADLGGPAAEIRLVSP